MPGIGQPPPQLPQPQSKPTTLDLDTWTNELCDDIDRKFLLEGVEHGFYIMDKNAQLNTAEMHNYKSATSQHHEQVVNQVREEIREGRYVITSTQPNQQSSVQLVLSRRVTVSMYG